MKDYNFKQSVLIVGVGCGLLWIGLYLFTPLLVNPRLDNDAVTKLEEAQLANAIVRYRAVFQRYPPGENAALVKALFGDNPQEIKFLNLNEGSTNREGQLLDLWNTPYKIDFDSTNNFSITSAGRNRVFGDGDDVVFSNRSNNFAQP